MESHEIDEKINKIKQKIGEEKKREEKLKELAKVKQEYNNLIYKRKHPFLNKLKELAKKMQDNQYADKI